MTSTDIARRTMTDLAIEPDQLGFTDIQVAALQQLGIEDAPEGQVAVFFHTAKRSGLDPFAKQIYMLGRRTKVKEWDEKQRKQVEKWVMKYTIQTGIDGYRVTGHRLAAQRGDDIEVTDPLWCGEDGQWRDVWLDRKSPPLAAKYSIIKNGKRFSATAMYDEYVQTVTFDGNTKPNTMWAKMPANQLSKCAEAAAWKKAYPQDFSGLVLEDAAQNITIDAEVEPSPGAARPAPKGGNAGLRAAIARKREPKPEAAQEVASDPVEKQEPAVDAEAVDLVEGEQLARLAELLDIEKLTTPEEKLEYLQKQYGPQLTDPRQLTYEQADGLIDYLQTAQAEDGEAKS